MPSLVRSALSVPRNLSKGGFTNGELLNRPFGRRTCHGPRLWIQVGTFELPSQRSKPQLVFKLHWHRETLSLTPRAPYFVMMLAAFRCAPVPKQVWLYLIRASPVSLPFGFLGPTKVGPDVTPMQQHMVFFLDCLLMNVHISFCGPQTLLENARVLSGTNL